MPVVVRNRSSEAIIRAEVSAAVRDTSGQLLTTGSSQGLNPNLVSPGEIAFGYLYFSGDDVPSDSQIDFTVQAESATGQFAEFESIRDLEIETHRFVNGRIVGEARNIHDTPSDLLQANVLCFDANGEILDHYSDFTDQRSVDPGDLLPFSVRLFGDCPEYLVAVSGHGD
jgi:hypothetical protein